MMDCVLPSRNARNGYLFTSFGRVVIKQAQYKDDGGPVDERCKCYTCQNFSRAYLRHLFLAGEMTFSTLATLHNLRRYLDIMQEIRQAILFGQVPEYLKAVPELLHLPLIRHQGDVYVRPVYYGKSISLLSISGSLFKIYRRANKKLLIFQPIPDSFIISLVEEGRRSCHCGYYY